MKPGREHRPAEEQKENASRIVACVNAMAGIPDPQAWMKAVREIIDATSGISEPAWDDDRMDYVEVQVNKIDYKVLRAALADLAKQEK